MMVMMMIGVLGHINCQDFIEKLLTDLEAEHIIHHIIRVNSQVRTTVSHRRRRSHGNRLL